MQGKPSCEWCGESFIRQRSTRRYCSSACRSKACHGRARDRARRERLWAAAAAEPRLCEWCCDPLPITARPNQVYCDRACKQADYRARVRDGWPSERALDRLDNMAFLTAISADVAP